MPEYRINFDTEYPVQTASLVSALRHAVDEYWGAFGDDAPEPETVRIDLNENGTAYEISLRADTYGN
jgi:hypothetical protein